MTLSWRSFLLLRKMLKMGTKKFGIIFDRYRFVIKKEIFNEKNFFDIPYVGGCSGFRSGDQVDEHE